MSNFCIKSKTDFAKIILILFCFSFLNLFWMKEIFFVIRWNMDVEIFTAIFHAVILIVLTANLFINKSSVWIIVVFFLLSFELLAFINCLEILISFFADGVVPVGGATVAPFSFVTLCGIFIYVLGKRSDFLLFSQLYLLLTSILYLMQKYSFPSFYLVTM